MSRVGRFDTVLLVVLVILGVFVGIAVWYTGYTFSYLHGVFFLVVHFICMFAIWRLRGKKDSRPAPKVA